MCKAEDIENSKEFLAIEKIYSDIKENLKEIDKLLSSNPDPALVSFRSEYTDLSRRVLLISAANSFERHLCRFIPNIFCSSNTSVMHNFISKQALSRKYHTLFQWDNDNKKANSFYKLFGDDFKNEIRQKIDGQVILKTGEKNFIELGNERNYAVHNGVKLSDIDSVYELYRSSLTFYIFLCSILKEKC